MKTLALRYALILIALLPAACVEPYDPQLKESELSWLVVDGSLDLTSGTATVSLSRTLPVKETGPFPPVVSALVRVEDDQGVSHPLYETSQGTYSGPVENAGSRTKYRLLIATAESREYASDFVDVTDTPPVDSLTWTITGDGIRFAVHTHDPNGASKYFRWKYSETYEYHANFNSNFMFSEEGPVVPRPAELQRFKCWRTDIASDILLYSTKHLSQPVVSNYEVTTIPYGSLKLSFKYSLLVEQQTLTEEAYDYWLKLQNSTEDLGGLFDPLPTEVSGNMYSLNDPREKVIGFFSGGGVQQRRITLALTDLPLETRKLFGKPYCAVDTVLNESLGNLPSSSWLIDAVYPLNAPGGPIGYTISDTQCMDCTVHGGSTTKPPFWE